MTTSRDGLSAPAAEDRHGAMTTPLRQTPIRFRWWLAACLLLVVGGFLLLHQHAPGPDLAAIVREPGALMLLALILLADLYPTLPWMRRSNPFGLCAFSTPTRSENTTTATPASVEGFNCTANRT